MDAGVDRNVGVIRSWYAAYNARDIHGLCELATESIEIVSLQPLMAQLPGTAFRGREGVRTLMQWTFQNYPRIRVDSVDIERSPVWPLASATFVYDLEKPTARRRVWALWDIEEEGIRRITAFASETDARNFLSECAILTPREREIFTLLAQGKTAQQIAEELYLSLLTVRTHIKNAKERLGARTSLQALSLALQHGELQV